MDKSDRSMSKAPAVTTLESVLKRLSTVPILGVDPFKFGDKATKNFLTVGSYWLMTGTTSLPMLLSK